MMSTVRVFLRFLRSRSIAVEGVTPEHVTSYVELRLAECRHKHERHPRNVALWHYHHASPIRRYLRLVRGQWPPEILARDETEAFRRQVCTSYGRWLTELHGFSVETLRKNGHAAKVFLEWLRDGASPNTMRRLAVSDIDAFLVWRNQGLRRVDQAWSG
jgi:hypothetical protein